MKIQDINFKKAFVALLVAFTIFTVTTVLIGVSNGRWGEAVNFEQSQLETCQSTTRRGCRERGGRFGRRHAEVGNEVYEIEAEVSDGLVPPTHSLNDRVLYGAARTYVRITSMEFTVTNVLGILLHIIFIGLLALWVYVDSKKREYHPLLWSGLTLFTHLYGLVIYLIVREIKRVIRHRRAEPDLVKSL